MPSATIVVVVLFGSVIGLVLGVLPFMSELEELTRGDPLTEEDLRAERINTYNQRRARREWEDYKRNTGWIGD